MPPAGPSPPSLTLYLSASQVYHHCLYGIRQDFVCANYTAFDMRTFICQFVNLVDCENSDSYTYR